MYNIIFNGISITLPTVKLRCRGGEKMTIKLLRAQGIDNEPLSSFTLQNINTKKPNSKTLQWNNVLN